MAEKLTRPRAVLEEIFSRMIETGNQLYRGSGESNTLQTAAKLEVWDSQCRRLLAGAFTAPEPAASYPTDFDSADVLSSPETATNYRKIDQEIQTRLTALVSIRDMLGLYEEPADTILIGKEHPASRSSTAIFIVHGRAEGPKQQVARFLENSTDAQPIILHEQAKRGQVIIETLETYAAAAAFAIVLLTADDHGGLNSQESRPRARQNVVFELGYFIGALGRSRVAVLYEESVELPSDMNGILYTVLDTQGAWKLGLGRELRAAGFAVDLNRAT